MIVDFFLLNFEIIVFGSLFSAHIYYIDGKSYTENAQGEHFSNVADWKMSDVWNCPMFDGSDREIF